MTTLALALLIASVALGIATWFRTPAVPILIISGYLPSATGLIQQDASLRQLFILGLTFLVFIAGTELSPSRIAANFGREMVAGIAQFVLMGLVGFCIAYVFSHDLLAATYVALAVGASSTLVVVRLLQERRQFYEPFGRFVLGVLLVQDLLIILALAIVGQAVITWNRSLLSIGVTLGLFLLSWLTQRYLLPRILVARELDEETLLITVLAVVSIFMGIAVTVDAHFIAGAFFAGFALSSFPIRGLVESQLSSLSDFFVALFFVALGTTLQLPTGNNLWFALALIVCVVIVTPPLIMRLAERAGISTRRAIESGLLVAQTSEFSIVIGLIGLQLGHISEPIFGVIGFVTVITMMLTPYLAQDSVVHALLRFRPGKAPELDTSELVGHVVLLGCGRTGLRLLERMQGSRGVIIVVVDEDPQYLELAKERGAITLRGDAADPRVIRAVKAKKARIVLSNLRDPRDNEQIARLLKRENFFVRVFEEHDAKRIEAAGGKPVMYSLLAANDFLSWFQGRFARNVMRR